MKNKLQAAVIWLIVAIVALHFLTVYIWPLLGAVLVLGCLLLLFKLITKDRFY